MNRNLSVTRGYKKTEGNNTVTEVETFNIIKKGESEPPYVKCYFRDISILNKVQRQSEMVMWELLELMKYDNKIYLNAGHKKDICRKLDLMKVDLQRGVIPAVNTVDQHLRRLVAAGLITRVDTGTFFANPDIFGKGAWANIQNIRMTIEYDKQGRKISSEITKTTSDEDQAGQATNI